MIFLAGRPPFETRAKTLTRLEEWLDGHGYVEYVRRTETRDGVPVVLASMYPRVLFQDAYPVERATLTVEWQLRRGGKDHYWLTWTERPDEATDATGVRTADPTLPDGYALTVGLHQDETHPDLGPAHVQREYPDGYDAERDGVDLVGHAPVAVLDHFVSVLPAHVEQIRTRIADATADGADPGQHD